AQPPYSRRICGTRNDTFSMWILSGRMCALKRSWNTMIVSKATEPQIRAFLICRDIWRGRSSPRPRNRGRRSWRRETRTPLLANPDLPAGTTAIVLQADAGGGLERRRARRGARRRSFHRLSIRDLHEPPGVLVR